MFQRISKFHWLPVFALLAAVFAIIVINPVGFIGGTRDDIRYLTAARCWVEHGPCIPQNHWEARWPVFAPISLFILLVGETRWSVQLWPTICGLTALFLVLQIGKKLWGPWVGLLAGLLIVATPAFAIQMFRPSVEPIEMALILAATLIALRWKDEHHDKLAFFIGLLLGIAFQVRETALIGAFLLWMAFLVTGTRISLKEMSWVCFGFLLPTAIEFLIYQQSVGNPLYRRQLSLDHIRIISSELPRGFETTHSAIFNPELIAAWRRTPGIRVHWIIDGPLNLLLNAGAGFSLLLVPILLVTLRTRLGVSTRWITWRLYLLAAAYIFLLTYFLSMDPKPRVMLMALVASSYSFALILIELWRKDMRPLTTACLLLSAISGSAMLLVAYRPARAEEQAGLWASQFPDAIEADLMTRRAVTFTPAARNMPGFEARRPYAMTLSGTDCNYWAQNAGIEEKALLVVGERPLVTYPLGSHEGAWLCLFRYVEPIAATQMKSGVNRSWSAGGPVD